MNLALSEPTVSSTEQRALVTRRVTMVGVTVDLALAVAKIIIGILAHSQAVVADGIHSLSDLISDFVILYAAHHSQQAADSRHPYGHGRFETVATLALALLLVLIAAGMIWDYTQSLFSLSILPHPGLAAVGVIVLSIAAKEWLYHYTRAAAQRIRSNMMLANAWHHRADVVSCIVVLIGLAGTMAGLPYLDAVAAVIVAIMIAKIGFDLAKSALQELVDTGLDAQQVQTIRDTILTVGGVRNLHMLRTRRIGGIVAADVHVLVEPRLSVSEGHMISMMVEQRLKHAIDDLQDVTVHIDPEDDEVAPNCLELPPRAEAIQRIEAAWQHIPNAHTCFNIVLHYSSGKIDVDAYFPLREAMDTTTAQTMIQTLRQALAAYIEFRELRVYFGITT